MLDLGSEGVAEGARGPAFLVNHFAGFESNCENPDGEGARGNAVVDVVVMGERSCGLRVWGCAGLRRERIVGQVWMLGIKSYACSKRESASRSALLGSLRCRGEEEQSGPLSKRAG